MADLDELAQLETERDWLRSMIAYQKRRNPVPIVAAFQNKWADAVAIGVLSGFGIVFVVGFSLALLAVLLAVQFYIGLLILIGVALLAYLLTRKVTIFGVRYYVGEALVAIVCPAGPAETPGESQTLQRLAECDARIARLKEGRS